MPVDIRTADSLGFPVRCTVTALTVQGEEGVIHVQPSPQDSIRVSIETAAGDRPGVCAVKVGVLADAVVASQVADCLAPLADRGIPVVVDPVIRASSDSLLIDEGGMEVLMKRILPLSYIVTPNRQELVSLGGYFAGDIPDEASAVQRLLSCGADAVLLTDGEGSGEFCRDLLYLPEGPPEAFSHPRIDGATPRGTGCALSTAVAVHLGQGLPIKEAVRKSIDHVTGLIRDSTSVGNQRLLFPGR